MLARSEVTKMSKYYTKPFDIWIERMYQRID